MDDKMTILLIAIIGALAVALVAVLVVLIVVLKKKKEGELPNNHVSPANYPPAQRAPQDYRRVKPNQPTEMPGEPNVYRGPREPVGYPNAPVNMPPRAPESFADNAPANFPPRAPESFADNAPANFPPRAPEDFQNAAPVDYPQQTQTKVRAPKRQPLFNRDDPEATVLGSGVAGFTLIRKANDDRIIINRPEFIIGKERAKVDYCVTNNNSVSRRHARIRVSGGKCYISDLGSTNCTYINGVKLAPLQEIALIPGDELRLSNEDFEFIG